MEKAKQINKKINKLQKQVKNNRIKINRKTRIKGRRRLRRRRRTMGIAYIRNFKKTYSILKQTGNSMVITGRDLVYQIPNTLVNNNNTDIITMIPCNPAYWLGTRISAIASGYQNYRPIKFNVHYVPQCAVTQQGNVIAGTLWDMAPNDQNLQQTLRTSNGGILTQCYKSATSKIQLGRNLQYNLFRMGGKFNQQSNPFIYIAMTIATVNNNNEKIIPGYFYVNYTFELKNPIGNTITYNNSGLIQSKNKNVNYKNVTAIYVDNQNKEVNIGSVLQFDNAKFTYNDQEISINENSFIWILENEINIANSEDDDGADDGKIELNKIYYGTVYSVSSNPFTIRALTGLCYNDGEYIWTIINTSQNNFSYNFPSTIQLPITGYILDSQLFDQDFGIFNDYIIDGVIRFKASIENFGLDEGLGEEE